MRAALLEKGGPRSFQPDPSLFSQLLVALEQHGGSEADLQLLRQEMAVLSNSFHKDPELLSTTMTVRLGSMLVVGFLQS